MMKITLINPTQTGVYSQPPLGLALIAAVLEREGYQVTVVEANAFKLRPEDVVQQVNEADIVGLTAMTPTINSAIAIAKQLKKAHPNLSIVLGGAHATLLPEETMAAVPEIDIIVRGEAEQTIIDLLPALGNRDSLGNIPGITYRNDDEIVNNPSVSQYTNLDSLPFLAYHLLPWKTYKPHPPHGRALPFAAIITSRGCPYRCSYCSKPVFGSKFRGQSPERVVDEVAYLQKQFGIKEFAFYDDVFTLDKKRAYAIADEIIKRDLKIHWTCETRVNLVDRDLLHHIKQAGCYSIAYGIESGSEEILNTLDKDISLKQIEEAARISREVGLQTIGYFMIGSPGESPETIKQTIQFAKKLKLDFAQFSVTTPFPGTKLYSLYSDGKKINNIPWESFIYAAAEGNMAPVFESDLLTKEDIHNWTRRAYRAFYLRPSYLWQRIQRTTSVGDLKVNLKGLAMLLANIRPVSNK